MPLCDAAAQVVHGCVSALERLVESLLQGDVALGHLETCLKNKKAFKILHQQCKSTEEASLGH